MKTSLTKLLKLALVGKYVRIEYSTTVSVGHIEFLTKRGVKYEDGWVYGTVVGVGTADIDYESDSKSIVIGEYGIEVKWDTVIEIL
jgi:hypothetical protein